MTEPFDSWLITNFNFSFSEVALSYAMIFCFTVDLSVVAGIVCCCFLDLVDLVVV